MSAGRHLDASEHSLALGVDPSRDVALSGCHCGTEGHDLLQLFYDRQTISGPAFLASNHDRKLSRATRQHLRQDGLAFLLSGAEGGWPASWWMAQATPAGLRHAAQLAGSPERHGGECSGLWGPDGRCQACGGLRLLTLELARQRLATLPAGPQHDQELWASQFVCPYHGRGRVSMIRTDKCCAACNTSFVRSRPVDS